MMEENETLRTLAEVAVALTGFTGIVAVLGRRAGGEWTPLELLRLRMLLETSLAVLFMSLLPIAFQEVSRSEETLWRISNSLQVLVHLGGVLVLYFRVSGLEPSQWPPVERRLTAALLPLSIAIIAAQVATSIGILASYGYFLYLLGLVYLLALAALHFVLLLVPDA